MTWQPQYGPKSGMLEGMAGLAGVLAQRRRELEERDRFMAEQMLRARGQHMEADKLAFERQQHAELMGLRQSELDRNYAQTRQNALEKAMAVYGKSPRNPMAASAAAAMLRNVGFNVGLEDVYEDVPGAQPQQSAAPPIQQGTPLEPPPMDPGQPPVRMPGPGDAPLPLSPQNDPAKRLVGKRIRAKFGNEEYALDPLEMLRAQETERQQAARSASGMYGGGRYGEVAAQLAAAGVDEKTVAQIVGAQMEREQGREYDWSKTQYQASEAEKRARIAAWAAANRPVSPAQAADDDRANAGAFEVSYDRWEKQNNVDKLTDQYDLFQGMASSAQAYRQRGDIINQRKALYEAARFITGPGILRQEEYDNTVRKTSGWSDQLYTKIQQNLTGDISPPEWAAMERFVANAQGAIKQRGIRAIKNFDTRYGAGRHSATVPDEVQAARQSLMERLGVTEEELGPPRAAPRSGSQPPRKGGPQKPWHVDDVVDDIMGKLFPKGGGR